MTTMGIDRPRQAAPSLADRARDVLGSEWTKLRSVRSTYWTLFVAAAAPIGFGTLIAFPFSVAGGHGNAPQLSDPLLPGFISLEYAVLAVSVLGVLVYTSECSSGLITTTFTAVPQRRWVLAAKAAVLGAVTLAVGELASFIAFFLIQAILSSHHAGVSLSHPGVPGAVLAEGSLLCVCALMGLGVGTMIRHTAGGIAAVIGLIFLPVILGLLPPPWNTRVDRFTLFYAAYQAVTLRPQSNLLSPGLSMLVIIAWPAATLLAAAIMITRRSA
jgi:ABC-2 type transport system permease protein